MNSSITLFIVVITYFGLAMGGWPKIKSNRATVALMGVGLLVVSKQIPFNALHTFLDFDTLILLFSMMIINANLRISGFFTLTGRWLFSVTRSPRLFLLLEIVLIGVLSALFLNDTICLMFTPLILEMMTAIRRNPIPYLLALAMSSNIGSVATLTGNPQNMIIGVASDISYLDFTAALLPVALISLGILWVILLRFYPAEFDNTPFAVGYEKGEEKNRPLLIKTLFVVAGLLIAFLVGAPIAQAAFLAACLLLFTRRVQPHLVFAEFDWSLLVFFSGLFVISGSLEANGITKMLFDNMSLTSQTGIWPLSGVTLVLSNLVSNVPAVLLLKPVVQILDNPRAGWLLLAASSTFAGNLTLLGSVANLIVAEIAGRWRVEIRFWEYTRIGLLVTLITVIFSTLWISFFLW